MRLFIYPSFGWGSVGRIDGPSWSGLFSECSFHVIKGNVKVAPDEGATELRYTRKTNLNSLLRGLAAIEFVRDRYNEFVDSNCRPGGNPWSS